MRRAAFLGVMAPLVLASPAWAQDAVAEAGDRGVGTDTGAARAGAAQSTPASPAMERGGDGWGVAGHPMVGYAPETHLLLGAGVALYHDSRPGVPGQRPDEYGLNLSYTTRQQGNLTLDGIKYLHGNDQFVSSSVQLFRAPSSFFGVGPHTSEGDEEEYTRTGAEAEIAFQTTVAPGLYVGPDYGFVYSSITDVAEGSQLASGTIRGSGTGVASGLGILATYDSTNSRMYKLSGTRVQLGGRVYHAYLGSSYNYGKLGIDARHYLSLPWGMVLALQVRFSASFGHVPFYALASLGGDKLMRGYSSERYLARHGLAGQAELRSPLFWRFGGVAFVGASEVEDRLADLGTTVRMAGGLGLRFAINQRETINMRLDVSCNSDGQFEKYLKLREAF